MIAALFSVAFLLLDVLWWVIIVQVVLSWLFVLNVLNTSSHGVRAFAQAIDRILAPLYRPIRAILPDFGGIDFSPLVLLILIQIVEILLRGAENSLLQYPGQ
ncbi:YggT family protein [Sphingomonas sp.]|uniref:YggT family protein n=1 Tax=Sphingomonas sp. TaxID=28214 RepID=UPI0025FF1337|nr:YggT family protein [Sphingomonas sp.]MBV9529373.1 YggT family protein [Sphingomonas sp.]